MLVQKKMVILKQTVEGWRKMDDMRWRTSSILIDNLQNLDTIQFAVEVVTSKEKDLVKSIMRYHEAIDQLNEKVRLQLVKLLVDVNQLAKEIQLNKCLTNEE